MVFCRFQTMNLFCPKHDRRKPDMKQHGKHHTIRSSPNMKPQTQRDITAHPSFISLGSTISPDTKHTQHERTSSLDGFSAAITVEIGQPGMSLPGATTMIFHVGFGFMGGLWSTDFSFAVFGSSLPLPETRFFFNYPVRAVYVET